MAAQTSSSGAAASCRLQCQFATKPFYLRPCTGETDVKQPGAAMIHNTCTVSRVKLYVCGAAFTVKQTAATYIYMI